MIASRYPLLQVNIFTFPGKAIEEAEAVRQAFIDTLKQRAFDELGPLDVQLVGWRGIEGRDVMVEVRYEGASSLYELVTPDMVPRIIQSHLDEHRPVRRWVVGKDFEAYYEPQKMHVSELLGKIDPQCLENIRTMTATKPSGPSTARGSTLSCRRWWPRGSANSTAPPARPSDPLGVSCGWKNSALSWW